MTAVPKSGESRREASPWSVVPFRPEHSTQVVELQRHLWSQDLQLNADYLKWKYFENPYIREPLLYLAFVGDRLVGMRGAFGSRWEVGEPTETHTLPYPDDLVVDPEFRGRGVPRAIMGFALDDLASRGYRYVVNLSAGRTTRLLSMRMGWREAGVNVGVDRRSPRNAMVERLALLSSRLRGLWRYADAIRRLGGSPGDQLFDRFDSRSANRSRSSQTGAIFTQSTPLHDEMEQLIHRLPKTGRFRHVRDQAYFRWRFRNPLCRYRFLYAGGDRIEGYLVLQRSLSFGTDHVRIVDWEAEREPVLEALLTTAIRDGGFPLLSAWRTGNQSAVEHTLDRHGFNPTEKRKAVLVRSVPNADPKGPWILADRSLDDASQWDIRMLYSMAG